MSNSNFKFPALRAVSGNIVFYQTIISFKQIIALKHKGVIIDSQVPELVLQNVRDSIVTSKNRILNTIIFAVRGSAKWFELEIKSNVYMEEPPKDYDGIVGVVSLDSTVKLEPIKQKELIDSIVLAVGLNPELANDEISVIFMSDKILPDQISSVVKPFNFAIRLFRGTRQFVLSQTILSTMFLKERDALGWLIDRDFNIHTSDNLYTHYRTGVIAEIIKITYGETLLE